MDITLIGSLYSIGKIVVEFLVEFQSQLLTTVVITILKKSYINKGSGQI